MNMPEWNNVPFVISNCIQTIIQNYDNDHKSQINANLEFNHQIALIKQKQMKKNFQLDDDIQKTDLKVDKFRKSVLGKLER